MWDLAHVGLALATSAAGLVNAFLLYHRLSKLGHFYASAGWGLFLARLVVATGAMSVFLYFTQGLQSEWLAAGLVERVGRLSLLIVSGALAYFGVLYATGLRVHQLLVRP